jgi:chromosome segregation ATPase
MTAISEDNPRYIKIMETMSAEDKNIIFDILSEKLPTKVNENEKEYEHNNSVNDRDLEEHNNMLLKIDTLERESQELTVTNQQLTVQNEDLKTQIVQINHNYFDLESKYNELAAELEYKNEKNNKEYEDSVSLSIQLSETKGKLDAREIALVKLKDEKEKIMSDFGQKVQVLKSENEILKEKSLKYDLLKEKLDKYETKIEELNNLKSKNLQNEKIIKDQDEKIKKLKSFVDTDKSKLLKRIEELNFQISEENEKIVEYKKEIEIYKENIINKENELSNFKKQVDSYKSNEILTEIERLDLNLEKKSTLVEIEEQNDIKKQKLELETKVNVNINLSTGFSMRKTLVSSE